MQQMIQDVEKSVTGESESLLNASDQLRSSAKKIASYAIEHMVNPALEKALKIAESVTEFAALLEDD